MNPPYNNNYQSRGTRIMGRGRPRGRFINGRVSTGDNRGEYREYTSGFRGNNRGFQSRGRYRGGMNYYNRESNDYENEFNQDYETRKFTNYDYQSQSGYNPNRARGNFNHNRGRGGNYSNYGRGSGGKFSNMTEKNSDKYDQENFSQQNEYYYKKNYNG